MSWAKHATTKAHQPAQGATVTVPPLATVTPVVKHSERPNAQAQDLPPEPQLQSRSGTLGDWASRYFLVLEANGGNYTKAAKAAKVGRTTVYMRRERDPAFAAAEQAAIKRGVRTLEAEAVRRAVEGVTKKRYGRDGKVLSVEREYSDQILLRLLEHRQTGSWVQRREVESSGSITFKTATERRQALEEARKLSGRPAPVEAIHGRS